MTRSIATMNLRLPLFVSALLLCAPQWRAAGYTYPELVTRLTDLAALAVLPPAGESTALASSYDRRSRYDATADRYVMWDANDDGSGSVRKEGDAVVLADVQGPGCLWRMWSATAGIGHVKIYLDDAPSPVVDLPFRDYFDGTHAPFNRPNLVYSVMPGRTAADQANSVLAGNNYTPVCFQRSCRIVADPGWGKFYQFTYTQFPAGTVVPTFRMDLSSDDAAALDRADKILGQCGQVSTDLPPETKTETIPLVVPAGGTATVADLVGSGAICALEVKLDLPVDPEAQRLLLRRLTLSIRWDDEAAPAVWSPLGDFFGYIGGEDAFQSLPVGHRRDGSFYSFWYMPFARKAHVEVGNDGPTAVPMTWQITHSPLARPITDLARFHAKWHRNAFLPARPDRAPDWTLLVTKGIGRYVGTHLHGWNPGGGWWGEGDDKFFVDGEKFPSSFGTGSEDYFGYAWGSPNRFSRPFHNQLLNEQNRGHFNDNRWHIGDSVPFQASFEGVIEKYFSDSRPTAYAAEAYWYLKAGGEDPYGVVAVQERVGYWLKP